MLGLDHCYKMLVDLGPVSQDKAVTACGFEGGATVVTFDNPGDDVRVPRQGAKLFNLQLKTL